ncbi:MAG: hypothetical protein ACLFTG_05265 [Alphaproteobacteria bacterium]
MWVTRSEPVVPPPVPVVDAHARAGIERGRREERADDRDDHRRAAPPTADGGLAGFMAARRDMPEIVAARRRRLYDQRPRRHVAAGPQMAA